LQNVAAEGLEAAKERFTCLGVVLLPGASGVGVRQPTDLHAGRSGVEDQGGAVKGEDRAQGGHAFLRPMPGGRTEASAQNPSLTGLPPGRIVVGLPPNLPFLPSSP
jgi:hypothetical protein